jgi:DNA replication protein DnaC
MSNPKCRDCGEHSRIREYGEDQVPIFDVFCDACFKAWAKQSQEMYERFQPKPPKPETPMPDLFADTDPMRLGELGMIAMHWLPSSKGLLIHGTTRKGKTRTAWYIANRLWNENKFKNRYLFLTMFELEARLVASWGKESWDKTMLHMTHMPFLFLDDLGKEKMTDRMASCLFALVDQRTMHKRPTIITTNLTGDTLLERFHDKEVGNAFLARLKDNDLFDRVAAK